MRWLFTVFLFAKNHRTAVTKPSINLINIALDTDGLGLALLFPTCLVLKKPRYLEPCTSKTAGAEDLMYLQTAI